MKETQLKQLNKNEQKNLKPIEMTPISKQEQQKNNSPANNQIIKNLPTWSIEPPLEIKRGN